MGHWPDDYRQLLKEGKTCVFFCTSDYPQSLFFTNILVTEMKREKRLVI